MLKLIASILSSVAKTVKKMKQKSVLFQLYEYDVLWQLLANHIFQMSYTSFKLDFRVLSFINQSIYINAFEVLRQSTSAQKFLQENGSLTSSKIITLYP